MNKRKFSKSTLFTSALLVGFIGFGLGFNYPRLEERFLDRQSNVNPGLPNDLDYESVEYVYDTLRQKYAGSLDEQKLLDGLKEGLVAAADDPYTEYLDQAAAEEFQNSLEGTFSGIGAEIAVKNERLVIASPLAGTPAEQAGLKPADFIAAINDESTQGMGIEEAVAKIRGDAGTEVKLLVVSGNKPPREVKITRQQIEVPSVTSELKAGNIGYIKLARFGPDSAQKLREAAQNLKSQGVKKIVLDVRNNPGGLLDVAVAITSEFLPAGTVVVEERRDERVINTLRASSGGSLVGLPTAVLVNQGSASASEIIAGALQDNNAATIVGEQSFGKGSVQELVDLRGRALLKVTIARWYTPNGRNISEEGIAPDARVELKEADFNADRDPQLAKALELLR